MNTVLKLCLEFILTLHTPLAFAPPRVVSAPPPAPLAPLADAFLLPHLEHLGIQGAIVSAAQALSEAVETAVATMRLVIAVVAVLVLLPPPPLLITFLPLLSHNFLHNHRLLLHHLRRRDPPRFAVPNATGVPSIAGSNAERLRPPASSWLDPSLTPPP